jgi:hypothetical protein
MTTSMIANLDATRIAYIGEERAGYTYTTKYGNLGITAPCTDISLGEPYTQNWSFPRGLDELWTFGMKKAADFRGS